MSKLPHNAGQPKKLNNADQLKIKYFFYNFTDNLHIASASNLN